MTWFPTRWRGGVQLFVLVETMPTGEVGGFGESRRRSSRDETQTVRRR